MIENHDSIGSLVNKLTDSYRTKPIIKSVITGAGAYLATYMISEALDTNSKGVLDYLVNFKHHILPSIIAIGSTVNSYRLRKAKDKIKRDYLELESVNQVTQEHNERLSEARKALKREHAQLLVIQQELGLKNASLEATNHKLEDLNKKLEDATNQESSAKKRYSNMLGNASHEIKTPLSTISMCADIALDTMPQIPERRYLERIKNAVGYINHLLEDMLQSSRETAGKLKRNDVVYSPKIQLSEIYDMMKYNADNRGIRLEFECDPSLPEYVLGDKSKLTQINLNLISNAIKFTQTDRRDPKVKVSISCGRIDDDTIEYKLVVKDEGIGISKADIARIFNRYEQVETNEAYTQGNGFGLSISEKLVKFLEGSISVESEIGYGSSFYVTVPLKISQAPITNKCKTNPYRLLLIDDDNTSIFITQKMLEQRGYVVDDAADARDAIDKLSSKRYNLVLTDISLPGIDGYKLVDMIRREDAGQNNKDVPILAVTGHDEIRDGVFIGKMDKPIKIDSLVEMIEQYARN